MHTEDKTKKAPSRSKILFLTIVLILGILGYFASKSYFLGREAGKPVALAKINVTTPTPTPTITITPTPTQTVFSASNVSSGYCLYAPILYYHHVQPLTQASSQGQASLTVDNSIFDQQMGYLASRGYHTITLTQLINALLSHSGLPAKSVALTFDDGYEDIYNYAYPIFKKYGFIANLAIPTGLIDNPGYLSWSQLKDMQSSGLVHFYNHTWSHASLNNSNAGKISSEVQTAQNQLGQNLGESNPYVVYPYGIASAFAVNLLRQDGFIAGVSTLPGRYQCDSFIMMLRRSRIGNATLSAYGL